MRLHVSAQGSSSLLLTQLGDVELKPFLQAAACDEAGPWGASCGSDHTLITNPAASLAAPHGSQPRAEGCPRGEA